MPPPPPPPTQMYMGPHACSHFLWKGDVSGRLSLEDFPENNLQKGAFFNLLSRDRGYFSEASREIRGNGGGGYDLYGHVNFPKNGGVQ